MSPKPKALRDLPNPCKGREPVVLYKVQCGLRKNLWLMCRVFTVLLYRRTLANVASLRVSVRVAASKMRAVVEADARHPIITFGKPHTHINWQGDQACSAKVTSILMGDQALFTPQTHSGSGDSTQASSGTRCPKACLPTAQLASAAIFYQVSGVQEALDPVNTRLITRGSHNRQAAVSEGQPKDRWTPKVQDWHEVDEDYEPSESERKAVNKVGP